jgi:peptide/nickel transport system substrate-binding protein
VRYAIDYNGIIKGLLSNVGTQPNSMIPVGMIGNDRATNNKLKVKTNVAKAKALLKQAGYPNGFDITLSYPAGIVFRGISFDLVAPVIQQDLAKAGIRVTLQPQDEAVLLAAYRAQKVPFILFEWGVDYPDSSDYGGPFSPGGGPAFRMWYTKSPAMGNLVDRAVATSNKAKRKALYIQIQKIWLKESPWIGLVQPRTIIVLHKGVTGYTYSPVYHNDFRYVHKS